MPGQPGCSATAGPAPQPWLCSGGTSAKRGAGGTLSVHPRAGRRRIEAPLGRAAPARPQPRFDDLPVISVTRWDVASHRAITTRLLECVARHGVPAVGFVNEENLL